MRIVLFVLCILAFLAGSGITTTAKSSIHKIAGLILYLMAAVFLVGAGTIEAIHSLRKSIEDKKLT